jgi:hypothetical protein
MKARHGTFRKAAGRASGSLRIGLFPVFAGMVTVAVIGIADAGAGQQPPPIQGVTGTIATETSIQETSEAGHGIFSKAARLLHLKRRNAVESGNAAGDETLSALKKGSAVVVHYTTEGENLTAQEIERLADAGLKQMEAVVTAVNRSDLTIAIRLADGTQQTLRLSDRAAADVGTGVDRAGAAQTARVIVYFKDERGRRVAHYFTRVS